MNVTRYDLRIVNRYAGDGTGEIETDATMTAGPHGRYVRYEDYQRLESSVEDQAVSGDHNLITSLEAEITLLKKELAEAASIANSNADQAVRLDTEISQLKVKIERLKTENFRLHDKLKERPTKAALKAAHDIMWIHRKDATRYRTLRQMNWNVSPLAVVCHPKESVKLGYDCPFGERLDEVLDEIAQGERK